MYHGVAGEERAVADHRVAADERAVGEDRLVADNRVMANVAVGHEKVFRPNLRLLVEGVGSVDGDVFAEQVSFADDEAGRSVAVFHVLRRIADDAAGVESVFRADRRVAGEVNVRAKLAAGPEHDVLVDD